MNNENNGIDCPITISMVLLNLKPKRDGANIFKVRLMISVTSVTVTTENAVCLFEKRLQMIGANSAPPAIDATLRTKSTIPPILGMYKAITTVPAPKIMVKTLATKICSFSPADFLMRFLYKSVANTVAARLIVVFALLDVAEIIPASTSPINPAGKIC